MTFKTAHNFGDILYLKTDPEQYEHIITGFVIRPGGYMITASWRGEETTAYDFEFTTERDPLKSMGVNNNDDD